EGGTVMGGTGSGSDRVYVGENDFNAPSGHTATVDFSLDAATAPPPANFVTSDPIETRATSPQDGPPTRWATCWARNGWVGSVRSQLIRAIVRPSTSLGLMARQARTRPSTCVAQLTGALPGPATWPRSAPRPIRRWRSTGTERWGSCISSFTTLAAGTAGR